MPLTEAQVKTARPANTAYKLADGGGMFLYVTRKGSRLWRLKYRFKGKEKLLALGSYPAVNLKQARERRDAARALLQDGRDPAAERKQEKRNVQLPDLGSSPIAEITALELLDVIRKLEKRGATFLAHRVLQLCKQVFRFGIDAVEKVAGAANCAPSTSFGSR